MQKYVTATMIISALIFLTFIPLAIINQTTGWIPDIIVFFLLTLFYYWMYRPFRLNLPIFTILILGHITHAAGIFGWYHISPIPPIGWERITHLVGSFSIGLVCYNFLSQWMNKKSAKKNFLILLAIFFMSLGIGALVEATEFWGYLMLGEGEGAFMFGPGDGVAGLQGEELMDVVGGGWINEGWDMTYNMLGIIAAMIIMWISGMFRKIPEEPHSMRWPN